MNASPIVSFGIATIALVVAALFVWGQVAAARRLGEPTAPLLLRTVVLVIGWLALSGSLAASGVLSRFDLRPPPMALMFVAVFALSLGLGLSRPGERLVRGLPLWVLIGVQGFRLPLELVMHRAANEGVMPHEMSFSGYNFDIVTGTSAILVAALAARNRAPRWLVAAWNAYGLLMLLVIAVVAFAASPMVKAFGDDPRHVNSWVTLFPYVWLPAVLVTAAIAGHIVVWRKLAAEAPATGAKATAH